MRRALRMVVALLPGLIFCSAASAQFEPVGYVGTRRGYVEVDDVDDAGSASVGLVGGAFIFSRLGVEVSLDFDENELESTPDGGVSFASDEIERSTTAVQGGVHFMPFPEHQVRPYLVGGIGYYSSRYSSPRYRDETISDGGYFAGLGLDLLGGKWNGRSSLVIEARWLFTKKDGYAEESIRSDGFSVSFGFRVKFD